MRRGRSIFHAYVFYGPEYSAWTPEMFSDAFKQSVGSVVPGLELTKGQPVPAFAQIFRGPDRGAGGWYASVALFLTATQEVPDATIVAWFARTFAGVLGFPSLGDLFLGLLRPCPAAGWSYESIPETRVSGGGVLGGCYQIAADHCASRADWYAPLRPWAGAVRGGYEAWLSPSVFDPELPAAQQTACGGGGAGGSSPQGDAGGAGGAGGGSPSGEGGGNAGGPPEGAGSSAPLVLGLLALLALLGITIYVATKTTPELPAGQ